MEDAVGSSLLEAVDGGVYGLAGGGEGAGGQHLDLLCMSNFGARIDDFLSSFLELLSEVSELQHLSFDEGVSQLLYGSIDDRLVWLSGLEDSLAERVERGLRTIARSCTQLDCEHRMSSTHSEECAWAGVVEYELHVFGLAFVIVGVVDGRGDTESSIRPILDEWWPWVCVPCGVVDNVLISACYYHWGRR